MESQSTHSSPQPAESAYEATFPAPEPSAETAPGHAPGPVRSSHIKIFLAGGAIGVLLLGVVGFSTYTIGYNQGRAHVSGKTTTDAPIQVPQGATIISQCAVGRGTQYVLPSNIPHGPVFNVYKGNVIGLEYMIGRDDLAQDMSFYNLPLYGKKYDHIDVGLMSQGHAGYPEPHYHVDIYNISRAASTAITCK